MFHEYLSTLYFLPNDARGIIQSRKRTVKRKSCDEYLLWRPKNIMKMISAGQWLKKGFFFCEAKTFIIFYGRCFLQTTSNCTLQVSDHLIFCFDVWQIFSIYERQINPSQWHSFFTIQKKLKVHKCLFSNFVSL